jgi:hypothetical protein
MTDVSNLVQATATSGQTPIPALAQPTHAVEATVADFAQMLRGQPASKMQGLFAKWGGRVTPRQVFAFLCVSSSPERIDQKTFESKKAVAKTLEPFVPSGPAFDSGTRPQVVVAIAIGQLISGQAVGLDKFFRAHGEAPVNAGDYLNSTFGDSMILKLTDSISWKEVQGWLTLVNRIQRLLVGDFPHWFKSLEPNGAVSFTIAEAWLQAKTAAISS